jgi:excisionase family DNA binding protein
MKPAAVTPPRCYTVAQICEQLQLPRRTFHELKRQGRLPFLEELQPRLGRRLRYRADLVDRYLAGQWGQPRSFRRSV